MPVPAPPGDGTLFDLGRLRTADRDANESAIRSLCHTVPVSGDAILCRVLGRYKMFADPADEGLSPHLMLDGFWEIWNTEALLGFLSAGMVAVDVGANLGYFTLLMADLVGHGGHVHAAEPNPRMMAYLRRSLRLNGYAARTTLHASPLGARVGERVTLRVPVGLPQNGHIVAAAEAGDALLTTTLDAIVGDGPVHVVKIDAEGAEEAIWDGMAGVLARRRPLVILMEFTADRYADPRAFLERMRQSGFALAHVDHRKGVLPCGIDDVLAGPAHEDRMLVLAR